MTIQEQLHKEAERRVIVALKAFSQQIESAVVRLGDSLGTKLYAADTGHILEQIAKYRKYGSDLTLVEPNSAGEQLVERVENMLAQRVVDNATKENP